VNGSLKVNQATLTVKANDASMNYGATMPTFTDMISGFVNGDSASVVSGSANLTTTATSSSTVGSYPITAAQGTLSATNYTFTFVNSTLKVNPATLTVKANDASMVYGSALPTFTATITGFVNGDNSNVVTGTASLTTTATVGSAVGSYPIMAALGTLKATNYTFTFVNGSLSVTPATLSSSPSIVYVSPSYTGTPGTVVNGHTIGYDAFPTIGQGVSAVSSGGTVMVAAATYAENVTIAKNLTLQGAGNGTIIHPASGAGVSINGPANSVTVENLRITGAVSGLVVTTTGVLLSGDEVDSSTTGVCISGGAATLTGDTLLDDATGIKVTGGGQLTLGAGNNLRVDGSGPAGAVGLLVSGASSRIAGLTLNHTAFSGYGAGAGDFYIKLTDAAHQGPELIDGTGAFFEGKLGAQLGASALQNVEQRIDDYHVDPSVGLVVVQKGTSVGGTNLTVFGTDGGDTINVNCNDPRNVWVTSSFAPPQGPFDVSKGRVIVFGLGGNDVININGVADAEVHCGAGNDTVHGGFGHDILFGGAGNDMLIGRGTADVLVGGGGQDVLTATSGQDLLIAGSLNPGYTTYSYLDAVRREWLDAGDHTKAMLHALAQYGVNHPDLPSETCQLSHCGGVSAFIYRKTGKNPSKVYGLRAADVDLGF
jgi:hypothetical protein